jgi:hypothetical protein
MLYFYKGLWDREILEIISILLFWQSRDQNSWFTSTHHFLEDMEKSNQRWHYNTSSSEPWFFDWREQHKYFDEKLRNPLRRQRQQIICMHVQHRAPPPHIVERSPSDFKSLSKIDLIVIISIIIQVGWKIKSELLQRVLLLWQNCNA